MKHTKIILIASAILMVLWLSGCSSTARTAGAERRWDRAMEQARMEAARESIEQGRLSYAIHLLEDLVESGSVYAEQAQQMLDELRKVTQEFAQARETTAYVTQVPVLY